ncbi:hypothetical protein CEXT_580221 [Caerostris extrusa]|uniref:Uncharacterized protein n=1 Tax=Caerostris extrusa TaxID=172846 RepID=A0AAV4SKG5_CAEEX|nr:hypothetical protein CEXT_580221 [Caerostris extrusa]
MEKKVTVASSRALSDLCNATWDLKCLNSLPVRRRIFPAYHLTGVEDGGGEEWILLFNVLSILSGRSKRISDFRNCKVNHLHILALELNVHKVEREMEKKKGKLRSLASRRYRICAMQHGT